MQSALDVLEKLQGGCTDNNDGTVEAITVWCPEIIDALAAALAEPAPPADMPMIEQKAVEPVGFVNRAAVNSAIIDRARGVGDTHTWSEKKTSFHSVPFYTSPQPAPHADVPMLTDEELREAFAQSLTSTYVCGRVWSAWGYGTMSEDDFSPASECDELLDSLVQAVRQKAGLK